MHAVIHEGTESSDVDLHQVKDYLARTTFFWLDIDGVDDDVTALLRDDFGFHELAIEDVEHFGQRPKCDSYDNVSYLVLLAAKADGSGVEEVHCFFNERYVLTIHDGACGALQRVSYRPNPPENIGIQVDLVHRILDAVVDTYFPVLNDFDDQVDDLEDEILKLPTEDQLGQLFDMKRKLLTFRKAVAPLRDLVAALVSGMEPMPGMTRESEVYFRDVYDHLIRLSDLVDNYRDLLSGVMDTHISTVSNRLNVVMKQLAIIATIFLPLSWLTGFFGQNFGYLVNRLGSSAVFYGAGLGTELIAVAAMVILFYRRGWLGGPTE